MTKLKKVLSKIYYYTWRILLVIILCCLSVYSVANTVNYFIDRNKQADTIYRQKQNIINPSINPQGLVSYCPLTNYFSYNSGDDYSYDFSNLLYNNVVVGQFNMCGNVLTIKDFTGDVISFDLPYLEDLTNDSYVFGLKYYSSYYDELYIEWAFNNGSSELIFEDFTYGSITTGTFNPSGSQYIVVEYAGTPFETPNLIQFEFYIFKTSDVINYFNFYSSSLIADYLLSSNIFVPFGIGYVNGEGNNYFYDSKYIQGMLDDSYQDGYDIGYNAGEDVGYQVALQENYDDIYNVGKAEGIQIGSDMSTTQAYNQGLADGLNQGISQNGFKAMANILFNAPYNILHDVFNFQFLGVNLWGLMSFVFTTALIFAIIKLFV